MAALFTVNNKHVPGDRQRVSFTMGFDASAYVVGGFPIPTAAQLGLNSITDLQFTNLNAVASTTALLLTDYVVNNTTNKIQLVGPTGIELTAVTGLGPFSIDGIAEGF